MSRPRRVSALLGGELCHTPVRNRSISGSHAGAVRWVFCDGGVGYSLLMAGADGDAHGGLLVGRDAEQALIAARLADREAGTAILVRGPAGIGKTTLAGLHHCR